MAEGDTTCLDENRALDFVRGELSASDARDVERHIDDCPSCRELISELARLNSVAAEPAAAPAETWAPGRRIGRFVVAYLAGAGGMGSVFRAVDTQRGGNVALKQVRSTTPEARERVVREVLALRAIEHAAVVRYVHHGTDADGSLYLAMEWLEGTELAKLLDERALSIDEMLVLGLRLASGLDAAHTAGLVHRDITPRNVVLPGGHIERAKLVDFGLARDLRLPTGHAGPTAGLRVGTPHYMSPEQAQGRAIDARSDVFTLGCVLFECLTRRRAVPGAELVEVLANLALPNTARTADHGVSVPPRLDALLARMLARSPAERPASMAEVQRELTAIQAARPRTGALGVRERRSIIAMSSVATLLAIALLVGVVSAFSSLLGPSRATRVIKPRSIVWRSAPSAAEPPPAEAAADDVDVDAPMLVVGAARPAKQEPDAGDGVGVGSGSGSETATATETATAAATEAETATQPLPPPPPTLRCTSARGELRDGLYIATLTPPTAAVDVGVGCELVLRGATLRGIAATPMAFAVPAVRAVGGGLLRLENCHIDGDIVVVGNARIELRRSRHRGNQRVIGAGVIDVQ